MHSENLSQRTVIFVNIAHAFDHFILLIYPTAVIVIAAEWGLDYATLLALATGTFLAFGLCSLPVGWLAGRYGLRNLMAVFFVGYGLSCLGVSTAESPLQLGAWLLILGVFSAIYHPIGATMLTSHARHLGRSLGWNGAFGNLGAATAAGITALIAGTLGWRLAFIVPGALCLITGLVFMAMVSDDGDGAGRRVSSEMTARVLRPVLILVVFAIAIVAGGMTFNMTTIALPKIIDERIGMTLSLGLVGWLATCVFLLGGLTQIFIGRLVDRFDLPTVFVIVSVFQPFGLGLAAFGSGIVLLTGLIAAMASIYGQVVLNDALVARYVPAAFRAKAFSIRYFLGFTVSGFAIPIISLLHGWGGFPAVLIVSSGFGAVIFCAALIFLANTRHIAPPPRKTV